MYCSCFSFIVILERIFLKNYFLKYPWTILAILAIAWLLGLGLGSKVSNMSTYARASDMAHKSASTNEVLGTGGRND